MNFAGPQHGISPLNSDAKGHIHEDIDITPISIIANADGRGAFTRQASAPNSLDQQNLCSQRDTGNEEDMESSTTKATYGFFGVICGILFGPWTFLFLCCQECTGLHGAKKRWFIIFAIVGVAFQMSWLGLRVAFGLPPIPWPIAYLFC